VEEVTADDLQRGHDDQEPREMVEKLGEGHGL
jgi:hypothetical protein